MICDLRPVISIDRLKLGLRCARPVPSLCPASLALLALGTQASREDLATVAVRRKGRPKMSNACGALIAVHARYRGSATRRRDGPAHLEQVATIKRALGSFPVLAHGNVRRAAAAHSPRDAPRPRACCACPRVAPFERRPCVQPHSARAVPPRRRTAWLAPRRRARLRRAFRPASRRQPQKETARVAPKKVQEPSDDDDEEDDAKVN